MTDKIGDYELRRGSAVIPFWPLAAGATVASATPALAPPIAPGTPSTVAVPPLFGIFDILIAHSADPVVTTSITAPTLPTTITATPTTRSSPLIPNAAGLTRIVFAIPVPAPAVNASCTLRLTMKEGPAPGTTRRLDIPLKITAGGIASDMFIFFVVHRHPPQSYVWTKLKAVDQSAPATAIAAAAGHVKVLRDGLTFSAINREFAHATDAAGFLCMTGTTRNVLGLPTGWPFIIDAQKTGFITRGHLLKLAAQTTDNLAPFLSTPDLRMTPVAGASLAAKKVLLDAGHGVVYADTQFRRSQEWYVAHKICDSVIAKLTAAPFNIPAANLFRTRTAGFGMIEPGHIRANNAPESSETRFEFDLPLRRVRGRVAAVHLKQISDLLLVKHDAATLAALAVTPAERTTLLTANAVTMTAIETRLNTSLAVSGKRVRPASMRWDVTANDYVFTEERIPTTPPPTTPPAVTDRTIPIHTGTAGDWFLLAANHMDVLAERAARWSVENELGSGPGANAATGRPAFTPGVRAALLADGAVDYMKAQILAFAASTAPAAWLAHDIKGWSRQTRINFFNSTPCDLYITVHANAGGGVGGEALVANATSGANAPPDDQIRIGKFFLKHVDGFGHGLHSGGSRAMAR